MTLLNLSPVGRVVSLSLLLANTVAAGEAVGLAQIHALLPRTAQLRTGSQFVAYIAGMDSMHREQAILKEVLAGNLPDFLRNLVPVRLDYHSAAGKAHLATVFVMPEYLAIGSSEDFVRIPMNLHTAAAVAGALGFILPTRKIVDAVYREAAFHFAPEPMTPGPQMTSTEYYRIHNQKIEAQSRLLGVTPGALVSGDKKDVVVTHLLTNNPEKIAIYGWHRLNGAAIQPLSTVHGACYADYSHGIRLVSETATVDGQPKSVYDLLKDPQLAEVVSDDGPIPNLRELMTRMAGGEACGPPTPRLQPENHFTFLTQRKLR